MELNYGIIVASPKRIAKKIGIPVLDWPGKCHQIARLLLKHNIVKGTLCYGHYHGYIHPNSPFGGRSFTHHGWIESAGLVIDPTRWVFDQAAPYIYIGPKTDEYDFGGNRVRRLFLRPCPEADPSYPLYDYSELGEAAPVIAVLTQTKGRLHVGQLIWLGSLPIDMFEGCEKEIYQWICNQGLKAAIPIDNRRLVLH